VELSGIPTHLSGSDTAAPQPGCLCSA